MAEQPLEAEDAAGTVPPEEPGDAEQLETNDPPQQASSGGPAVIRDRYLVDSASPMQNLDSPSARAFRVEDRRELGRKLFGLVCTPDLPVRVETMKFLQSDNPLGVVPFVDWDVVFWPPLGQNTMITVFEQPLGGRVMDRLARKDTRITEYDVPRLLAEPLIAPLQYLSENDAPHRAVRAENIFFMDEDMSEIVFGEHITSPPGFNQPIAYESLARAMSRPEGRGLGSSADDIYAFGVSIGMLVLGHNPVAKIKDEDQIASRLEHGSYNAIFGDTRVPLPLLEPLRGMMNDDEVERWDFGAISNWLTGQRNPTIKKMAVGRADAPYAFRGKDYRNPRLLALHFVNHISEAARSIKDEAFLGWVKRGLGDADRETAVKGVIQNAQFHKDGFQGTDDYLVSKVATILDPQAPIRYKGYFFMPDGYGTMVALEAVRNNNTSLAAELLTHDIPAMWLNLQEPPYPGTSELTQTYAKLKSFLAIKEPGYGIERLLYEICTSLPCQSPLLAKKYVMTIEHLLPALDEASKLADTQHSPLDRHMTAFIAARFDQDIHPHLKALASPKEETSLVGMLSLLAFLQWKQRQPAMLGLSSWVGGLLGPCINSYHNRITRRDIEKDIPGLVRKGSLPELFELVDNAERRQEDRDGYAEAQLDWLAAEEEILDIEGAGDERLTKAERAGQQAAAMISIVMMMTTVTVLLLIEAW